MSAIKGANTKPEIKIRKLLYSQGFRYRLNNKKLSGKPDIVLAKYKAAIFVHGCFWHKHNCHLFKMPSTRTDFWNQKISGNVERDILKQSKLADQEYRILVIWECALKGKSRLSDEMLVKTINKWIKSPDKFCEIIGS